MTRRAVARWGLVVFVVALVPRLYVALAWSGKPVWDGYYYDIGARSIASGLGYSGTTGKPWCHYPVGYSALIGAAYRAFGASAYTALIVNALFGAALAAAVYALARYVTSETRARVAGMGVALYPGLILYSALLMTEVIAAVGLVVAAWLVARDRAFRPRTLALAGVVLGLATLVRPQSILCAPALALLGYSRARGLGATLRGAAVATVVSLAVVAPWTARNCKVMDGCAFVSTNGGWNLAIGSFPRATGRFETLRAGDGCHIVTGQVQQNDCWTRLGWQWIAAEPRRWLALVPKKLGHTFDHESFPIGYLSESRPDAWPESRRRDGRAVLSTSHRALLIVAALAPIAIPPRRRRTTRSAPPRFHDVVWRLLAPAFALLAVVLATQRAIADPWHPFWPLALLIPLVVALRLRRDRGGVLLYIAFNVAALCVLHAVFFGEDRYHMVVTPLLFILAATVGARRLAPAAAP